MNEFCTYDRSRYGIYTLVPYNAECIKGRYGIVHRDEVFAVQSGISVMYLNWRVSCGIIIVYRGDNILYRITICIGKGVISMKKLRLLTAAVTSSMLAFSTIPLCANANYISGDSKYVDEYIKNAVPAENEEITDRFYSAIKNTGYFENKPQFYIIENIGWLIMVSKRNDLISFRINGQDNYNEISAIVYQIFPDCDLTASEAVNNNRFNIKYSDGTEITEAQARELYAALGEKYEFSNFELIKDWYEIKDGTGLTQYTSKYFLEPIKQYVAENDLDWRISYTKDPETGEPSEHGYVRVRPAEGDDPAEYLNIELSLNEAGIYGDLVFLDKSNSTSNTIDLLNAVEGDANLDGEMNMADAVFTMQAVSNPDKYGIGSEDGMTAQGTFNADLYEPGSGITNADALAIQRKMLNIE